jgi:hypothetical protein
MPSYRIRLINSEFDSTDETDFPSLEAVRRSAVDTASKVVAEAIAEGEDTSAVEVQICEGSQMVSRQVVTLSVVDLTPGN